MVAFFFCKIIPVKSRYKTHNDKFLAIVEAFKIWRHYLKSCKYKIFILTNHNNLCRFMDTKNLSFRQVHWAQKLSYYYFCINYSQSKANGAADAISWYPQWNAKEKATFQAKNIKILQ